MRWSALAPATEGFYRILGNGNHPDAVRLDDPIEVLGGREPEALRANGCHLSMTLEEAILDRAGEAPEHL